MVRCSGMELTRTISGEWVSSDHFKLDEPVRFRGMLEDGEVLSVEVPEGFVTDFASVPRVFWTIIPRDGLVSIPAVIHDFLYRTQVVSRKDADWVMLRVMKEVGVPGWKRWIIHRALRAFGALAWKAQGEARREGATVEELVKRELYRRIKKRPHK